jgi:hypothetical protein
VQFIAMLIFLLIYIYIFIIIGARGFGTITTPIVALVIAAGIRGNVGYDTCEYKTIFSIALVDELSYIEPGFYGILWFMRQLTNEPQLFLMFIAVIQGILLYAIAKQVPNNFIWLGIFTAVFSYSFFFTTIRGGLAMLMLLLGYAKYLNKQPLSPFYAAISPLIHYSAFPSLIIFPKFLLPIISVILLVFLISFYEIFQTFSIPFLDVLLWKLLNFKSGLYGVDVAPAWHVVAAIAFAQLLIVLTVKGWRELIIFTILVSVTAVADFYFGRIGRVQIFGLLALSLLHSRDWREYRFFIKMLIIILYSYYSYSFTVYPILSGIKVQELHGESKINSEPGNYHIWLFNDKNLCEY